MTESDIQKIACDIAVELSHAGITWAGPEWQLSEAEIAELIASRLRAYVQRQAGGESQQMENKQ